MRDFTKVGYLKHTDTDVRLGNRMTLQLYDGRKILGLLEKFEQIKSE